MNEEDRFKQYFNDISNLLFLAEIELSEDPEFKKMNLSGYLNLGKGLVEKLSNKVLIEKFITHTNMYWKYLIDKNDEVLIEQTPNLMKTLPIITIEPQVIRKAVTKIKKSTKDNIWISIHRLVKVSIKYIAKNKSIAPDFKLAEEAKRWNIQL